MGAITCASTTHACAVNQVRDDTKNDDECDAAACTDPECCKDQAWTCAVPDYECAAAGQVRDSEKDSTLCGAVACTDDVCCKAAITCASTTHACAVNQVRDDTKNDDECDAAACTDLECCKAQEWTCAVPVHKCETNFVRDTEKDATKCGTVTCTDTQCCKKEENGIGDWFTGAWEILEKDFLAWSPWAVVGTILLCISYIVGWLACCDGSTGNGEGVEGFLEGEKEKEEKKKGKGEEDEPSTE